MEKETEIKKCPKCGKEMEAKEVVIARGRTICKEKKTVYFCPDCDKSDTGAW